MEQVVLLDDAGHAIGTEAKATVHTTETPLHLAFSSYVFDSRGNILLTRRALDKPTFPGVLTNSCCGHPAPDEPVELAVRRRLRRELGMDAEGADIAVVLPEFRYRAVAANGIVENEICPVLRVLYDGPDPDPAADEVHTTEWVSWSSFAADVLAGSVEVSPWCRDQVEQLFELGDDPALWPAAPSSALPPVLRNLDAA